MQRALTLKISAIFFITLAMLIPLSLIQGKISERDYYRIDATNSVAESWTGSQTIMTPILIIPYTYLERSEINTNSGWRSNQTSVSAYKLIPAQAIQISGSIATETLMRGIYKIPVYESDLTFRGQFSRKSLEEVFAELDKLEMTESSIEPILAIHIADSRGIQNLPALNWGGQSIDFEPGAELPELPEGIHAPLPKLDLNSFTERDLEFNLSLSLKGMENLSFIPAGDQVDIALQSVWPHPEFVGSFLPVAREIGEHGFSANWQVTQFASNIRDKLRRCETRDCSALYDLGLGVNLIDSVDVYLKSERSVKYGILFIGLSFISFFLFENLKKIRIHPIQYGLVGLSIATFYLLLISLSEHISFGLSYLIATLACVTIIFSYLKFVLAGIKNSIWFSCALSVLYTILYIIIQAEDFALLMGAVLVFGMLSIVMMVTRNIDWYQIGNQLSKTNND